MRRSFGVLEQKVMAKSLVVLPLFYAIVVSVFFFFPFFKYFLFFSPVVKFEGKDH